MNGIIVAKKESGFTSMDCCALVRKLTGEKRVGHTGTLDPNAYGVLPICIGKATRLIEYMDKTSKTYYACFMLGLTSDTEDVWGNLTPVEINRKISKEELLSNIVLGEIEQIPPMYSAKKINGKKLYDIAREGKVIERKPSKVILYDFELIDFDGINGLVRIECSRGTYIRTIIADLGKKLGTGAVMTCLVRTETSGFNLKDSISISKIKDMIDSGSKDFSFIRPIDDAMSNYPRFDVDEKIAKLIINGNPLFSDYIKNSHLNKTNSEKKIEKDAENDEICTVYYQNKLIAVLRNNKIDKVFNENI